MDDALVTGIQVDLFNISASVGDRSFQTAQSYHS